MLKYQDELPAGYRWFNGQVLKDHQLKTYNYLSSEINRYLAGGYEAFRGRIESLLNERARHLKICFDINREADK